MWFTLLVKHCGHTFNTPFLYTYDGFTTEEINRTIKVEGETWRRLKVDLPWTV